MAALLGQYEAFLILFTERESLLLLKLTCVLDESKATSVNSFSSGKTKIHVMCTCSVYPPLRNQAAEVLMGLTLYPWTSAVTRIWDTEPQSLFEKQKPSCWVSVGYVNKIDLSVIIHEQLLWKTAEYSTKSKFFGTWIYAQLMKISGLPQKAWINVVAGDINLASLCATGLKL